MHYNDFIKSIEGGAPPEGLSLCLTSLWFDAKGDWHKAHSLIDSTENKEAYWVHAYLHRKEGDLWNAGYWYRKAGKLQPAVSLNDEWATIVKALL